MLLTILRPARCPPSYAVWKLIGHTQSAPVRMGWSRSENIDMNCVRAKVSILPLVRWLSLGERHGHEGAPRAGAAPPAARRRRRRSEGGLSP